MKEPILHQALTDVDDRFLNMVDLKQKEIHVMKTNKPKKVFSSLLIAAVLISLFTATAFAISSIHTREQERLREELEVRENAVHSYVEYEVGDQADGVVILSTINDGAFQKIYLDVSPVTAEEAEAFPETLSFAWSAGENNGIALPHVKSGRTLNNYEAIHAAIMEDSYDAESETLTLECDVPIEAFEGNSSLELRISMRDDSTVIKNCGSATVKATEGELRFFDFGGAVYHDAEHGKDISLVGLELSPVSAVWRFRYEGDEQIHAARDQKKLVEWAAVEDTVALKAEIHFLNGESFSTGGTMTANFADNAVECDCFWNKAINLNDIQSITIDDTVLWER